MRQNTNECLDLWQSRVCLRDPKSHKTRQNNRQTAHPGVVASHGFDGKVAVAILYCCLHRLVVPAHRSQQLCSVPVLLKQTDKRCQSTEAHQQTAWHRSDLHSYLLYCPLYEQAVSPPPTSLLLARKAILL